MTCPNCNSKVDSIKSVIKKGKILIGCDRCIHNLIQGNPNAAKYHREQMKREHAKDIVQPIEKDYAKAYGIEAAREAGWDEFRLRKYS